MALAPLRGPGFLSPTEAETLPPTQEPLMHHGRSCRRPAFDSSPYGTEEPPIYVP